MLIDIFSATFVWFYNDGNTLATFVQMIFSDPRQQKCHTSCNFPTKGKGVQVGIWTQDFGISYLRSTNWGILGTYDRHNSLIQPFDSDMSVIWNSSTV